MLDLPILRVWQASNCSPMGKSANPEVFDSLIGRLLTNPAHFYLGKASVKWQGWDDERGEAKGLLGKLVNDRQQALIHELPLPVLNQAGHSATSLQRK